jgi:hypothetical protein
MWKEPNTEGKCIFEVPREGLLQIRFFWDFDGLSTDKALVLSKKALGVFETSVNI